MRKIVFNFFLGIFLLFISFFIILSTIGIETDKFNNLISEKASQINNSRLKLNSIKFKIDLNDNLKEINFKLLNTGISAKLNIFEKNQISDLQGSFKGKFLKTYILTNFLITGLNSYDDMSFIKYVLPVELYFTVKERLIIGKLFVVIVFICSFTLSG